MSAPEGEVVTPLIEVWKSDNRQLYVEVVKGKLTRTTQDRSEPWVPKNDEPFASTRHVSARVMAKATAGDLVGTRIMVGVGHPID